MNTEISKEKHCTFNKCQRGCVMPSIKMYSAINEWIDGLIEVGKIAENQSITRSDVGRLNINIHNLIEAANTPIFKFKSI